MPSTPNSGWLFLNFAIREFRNRYWGSVSGVFWALVHPLALLGIYSLVFAFIFRVKLPGMDNHGFTAFVALALWPWLAFQEAVQRGTLSIQANGALVKKVAFSHELLPYAAISATYAVHLAGYAVVLVALAVYGEKFTFQGLPPLALLLAAQMLAAVGLSMFLAPLQVIVKDVEHILLPTFMIWFYATPVLYPLSLVPPQLARFIEANPMTYFMERTRDLMLFGSGFRLTDVAMLAGASALFLAGRWFLRRLSPHLEDFL
jgi:lipopolysaccharide transport system permease protein